MGRQITEDEAAALLKLRRALARSEDATSRRRGEFYTELVRLCDEGVSQASIARTLHIAPPTLWQKLREIAPRYTQGASKASIKG